jgi:release factor glutamine methyltransferase
MVSVKEIWDKTLIQLEQVYSSSEAKNVNRILFEDGLGVKQLDLLMNTEIAIDETKLNDFIERLIQNEPIQYVTGLAYFYGREFMVRKGALIPRPDTEELVQLVVSENDISEPLVIDVGTGSGCIAISLALELSGSVVLGTDISKDALKIAKENALQHGINLEFIHHNILESDLPNSEIDILISNPPYIPSKESSVMSDNVLAYEPHIALFVPDEDPMLFYKQIATAGKKSLKKTGRLYFEIHEDHSKQIQELLHQLNYTNIQIFKDMQGKERMVRAINSTNK